MEKLFKDLDRMKYGFILTTCIMLGKSIEVLEKHDTSFIASTVLESEINDRIDLFFDMSNRLLK